MVSALGSADRGGRVAPAAADPSQVTGRVKGRDNQLHRARVLEVRIQSPPAESRTNFPHPPCGTGDRDRVCGEGARAHPDIIPPSHRFRTFVGTIYGEAEEASNSASARGAWNNPSTTQRRSDENRPAERRALSYTERHPIRPRPLPSRSLEPSGRVTYYPARCFPLQQTPLREHASRGLGKPGRCVADCARGVRGKH